MIRLTTPIPIKEYIARQFLNDTYRFKCDCVVPLDIIGVVKDYEISGNEIVLLVESQSRLLHIGLNTPNLYIEKL